MILHIVGLTPDCIDEIANNAINTDASPQIDIILEAVANEIELKCESNKTVYPISASRANAIKSGKVKSVIKVGIQGVNLNDGKYIDKLKEDPNEFCSVVGNDNKMGADVKGKPFVRFLPFFWPFVGSQ